MNLRLLGIVAAIAGVLAAFVFLYELGYDAGENNQKAIMQKAVDTNREQYDEKLKARLKEMQANYKSSLRLYRDYEAKRASDAIARAKLELEAEDKSNEITNRIQQVVQTSDCSSVNADTYRVYRDTRRIVLDPRNTRDTEDNDTDAAN